MVGPPFARAASKVQPVSKMVHDGMFDGHEASGRQMAEKGDYRGYDCVNRWPLSLDRSLL